MAANIELIGNSCCGCGACIASCPRSCITMKINAYGFYYPEIDQEKCINCGRCLAACPVDNKFKPVEHVAAMWAYALEDRMVASSSSGGLFGLIARNTLSKGGVVYGAAFSKNLRSVKHIRISSNDRLAEIQRSKYLQSLVSKEIYEALEHDLKSGLLVLYSGTACQVAAMRHYLDLQRVSQERLLAIDVICHGVPSPKLWANWLDFLDDEFNTRLSMVNFRDKKFGWENYSVAYLSRSPNEIILRNSAFDDWYMKAFLNNASLRESCFNCPSKSRAGSDITLGDFWGIASYHPGVKTSSGVSAVLVNSEKGSAALSEIANLISCGDSSYESILRGNPSLRESSKPFRGYTQFMDDLASGMCMKEMLANWSFKPTVLQRMVSVLSAVKKKVLRKSFT